MPVLFDESGVVPPFLPGTAPTSSTNMSPYAVELSYFAKNFAYNSNRVGILEGLLDFRAELRNAGFVDGYQWLAGSYLEDCENIRGRFPKDIDIVTFAHRPNEISEQTEWVKFYNLNRDRLFSPKNVKARFSCDAQFIDLDSPAKLIVSHTRFWFGLFSHQRVTNLWKGMLQVPLVDDDESVRSSLK